MNRFDRLFGILLHLRKGRTVPASDLAAAFNVSTRTIYRDVETLSLLGIPVYAERGREGGFRLLEGFFLPPIMFTKEEAVSLVLAITLLQSLRSRPFTESLTGAEIKLLAAMPDTLRGILAEIQRLVGFEQTLPDVFHPEPSTVEDARTDEAVEGEMITLFLRALLDGQEVHVGYRSPYRQATRKYRAVPLGVYWDRGHWYLIGMISKPEGPSTQRLWRSDRVLDIRIGGPIRESSFFDVRKLVGRGWLDEAMQGWVEDDTVRIRISAAQAERLRADWYFRHAQYEESDAGIMMTFGERDPEVALELLRWLGPGAELIEPEAWRDLALQQLIKMIRAYEGQ